jgi:drug/metabolite transporter (DMT)-like permease
VCAAAAASAGGIAPAQDVTVTPNKPETDEAMRARLLLVALAFAWGTNWPAIKIGLEDLTPWGYRTIGFLISTVFLLTLMKFQGLSLRVPRGRIRWDIVVSSLLNIVAFGLFSTFAQLTASTGRTAVVTYSFPVWASLLGWLMLGERLNRNAVIGLALCIAGLAVLVYPVLGSDALIGLSLALACAITWAIATIYIKIARLPADLAITTWQVIFAAAVMVVLYPMFRGMPTFEPVSLRSTLAVVYSGIVGAGLAYIWWFRVAGALSAATASIGTLAVPVIGVVGSAILLGERPTAADWVGFALIFAAAACVVFAPRERTPPQKP